MPREGVAARMRVRDLGGIVDAVCVVEFVGGFGVRSGLLIARGR